MNGGRAIFQFSADVTHPSCPTCGKPLVVEQYECDRDDEGPIFEARCADSKTPILVQWVEDDPDNFCPSCSEPIGSDHAEDCDEPEEFDNAYDCPCGTSWRDTWTSACDDDCPACGTTCSPTDEGDDDVPQV